MARKECPDGHEPRCPCSGCYYVLVYNAGYNDAAQERDIYKKAKEENDERFMIERGEARQERDDARAELGVIRMQFDLVRAAFQRHGADQHVYEPFEHCDLCDDARRVLEDK